MYLNIDELLKIRKRSRYWLAKEIKVTYPTIMRLADNKAVSTTLKTIENICIALECTPNELLILEK